MTLISGLGSDGQKETAGIPTLSATSQFLLKAPPSPCHPERTRISCLTALPAATYAALRKESRMESTEATVLDRKSGGAEGPVVRPGFLTKVWVSLVLTQTLQAVHNYFAMNPALDGMIRLVSAIGEVCDQKTAVTAIPRSSGGRTRVVRFT